MMPILRTATVEDEPFLWRMLFEASHAADDGMTDPAGVRDVPGLALYVEGWGRPTDLGVVATDEDGTPLGAAWVRLLVGDQAGYGYVDERTPELAIAVEPTATGQGLGTLMLARLLEDATGRFAAVCLSVRADNPALRLYERLGFRLVEGSAGINRVGGTSVTMVRSLIQTP